MSRDGFDWILGSFLCQERRKKRDTCKEPRIQKSEKRRKKEAGVYQNTVHFPHFFSTTYKGKKSELDLEL